MSTSAQSNPQSRNKQRKIRKTSTLQENVNEPASYPNKLGDIRQRLAFLCHDLRTFSASSEAAERLNSSVCAHFLGPPYISTSDAEFVLSCALPVLQEAPDELSRGPTLGAFLDERMAALLEARRAKAALEGQGQEKLDFVLCTSHDLAPLLQEACGLPKQHFETRVFKDAYARWEKDLRKAAKKSVRREQVP